MVTLVMPLQKNGKDYIRYCSKLVALSIPEKGIATTTTSLLAYVGEDMPDYIQNETDAFICKRNKKGVDWLEFLFEMIPKESKVLIIYDIKGMKV